MTAAVEQGSRLLMPLLRLSPATAPLPAADGSGPIEAGPAPRAVSRTLDLDSRREAGLDSWAARVRAAPEAMLLVDDRSRVVAMSAACGRLLQVAADDTIGVLLVDLLLLVDFTAAGVPLCDPQLHTPPLRALRSGGMARALMRSRDAQGTLTTYDMVGVALADGVGALAFLTAV